VLAAYADAGFTPEPPLHKDAWATLVLTRGA
jgi:hypothetical protein